jgi:hypothetical protein
VRLGLQIPQGYFNEFEGWEPTRAARRVVEICQTAERIGFDSVWFGEHVTSKWGGESIAFDCFTIATAVAAVVPRVEIGFDIVNTTFRNPALTAKISSTLDAVSDGRLVLGLGTGFKPIEADQFGYPFPPLRERLQMLGEHFEIVTRMVEHDGRPFTFAGEHARVHEVVNSPRSVRRPRIKILAAGEGPNVTMRLAARYADIFNFGVEFPVAAQAIATLRDRCEEIGRDPATMELQTGLNASWPYLDLRNTYGQRMMANEDVPYIPPEIWAKTMPRVELIAGWRDLGMDELILAPPGLANTDETLDDLIEDVRKAGVPFPSGEGPTTPGWTPASPSATPTAP